MSLETARAAIGSLTDTVLADPELRAIAQQAESLDDFAELWKHDAFRAAHDEAISDVSEDDVREYAEELSEDDLGNVTGGIGLLLPAVQKVRASTNPRDLYIAALGASIQRQLR